MVRLFLLIVLAVGWALPLSGQELIPPGKRQAVISTEHLTVFVPDRLRHQLVPLVQKADRIYVAMAADAGYTIERPLFVLLSDREDRHNGFSRVIPSPLVQVELVAATPHSGIAAYDQTLRTLIHEMAHHITNDRDHGFRRGLRRVFGRVMPGDIFSLLLFYLSTPAHQTMPDFWHEGLAMWAESTYALGEDEPLVGRAHDPLQWARWRLGVLNDAIPDVGEWRYITHRYPFARNAYDWGLMYLRALVTQGYDPWELAEAQSRQWAFSFNRGVRSVTGIHHRHLLRGATYSFRKEMSVGIQTLQDGGAAEPEALVAGEIFLGIPAWRDATTLLAMQASAYQRPRIATIDSSNGQLRRSGPGVGFTPLRQVHGGPADQAPWLLAEGIRKRSLGSQLRSWLGRQDRVLDLYDHRLRKLPIAGHFLAGDARWLDDGHLDVAAIERRDGGEQALIIGRVDPGERTPLRVRQRLQVPYQGRPWYPAWRPQHQSLAWVEQHASGFRLVLHDYRGRGERQLLWEHEGRILHPRWSHDGQHLYVVSDISGVANAWVISFSDGVAQPAMPVSNVIGSVMAVVPAPENDRLALLLESSTGSSLAIIANDPLQRPEQLPQFNAAWQRPEAVPESRVRRPIDLSDAEHVDYTIDDYHGLGRIRPWYWTPTTTPVPEGGWGAAGVAADPLATHVIRAGAGIGVDNGPVGRLQYTWSGWHLSFGTAAWHSEWRYDDLRDSADNSYKLVDRFWGGELRMGRGFSMGDVGNYAYLAAGAERIRGDYRVPETPGPGVLRLRPQRDEHYLELRLGRHLGGFRLPDGYGSGTGISINGRFRHSGLGGDVEGNLASGALRLSMDVIPQHGQQLVLLAAAGWNDGNNTLRRSFEVGGNAGYLPRGYGDVMARGRYLSGGSVAWRSPLWRPFTSWGPSALVHRQLILEGFFDAAQANDRAFVRHGDWYRSAGLSLHSSWLVWRALLNPGIGAAYRFDGDRGVSAWFTLDFPW